MADARSKRGHTGRTKSGNVRDVKVQRIGRVTVYKRGKSYCLYYREKGKSTRRKVAGNLATARAMASRTSAVCQRLSQASATPHAAVPDSHLPGSQLHVRSVDLTGTTPGSLRPAGGRGARTPRACRPQGLCRAVACSWIRCTVPFPAEACWPYSDPLPANGSGDTWSPSGMCRSQFPCGSTAVRA